MNQLSITGVSKQLSLFALIGLVGIVGLFFYQVIQPFVIALFIAVVLTVLFQPVQHRLSDWIGGRNRIAAGITTFLIIILIVAPLGTVLLMAGGQLAEVARTAVEWFDGSGSALEETLDEIEETALGQKLDEWFQMLSPSQQRRLHNAALDASNGLAAELYQKTRGMVSDLIAFVIGLAVMTLGLYYFLADGKAFLIETHRLLPFRKDEERQLLQHFQSVCRGVVLGTVVAGMTQAVLAGVAFALIGVPQLWLLTVLTMVCSLIPLVGAAAVWFPVGIALLANEQYAEGIGLLLFGSLVISMVDNLIRAHVIGSEAKLHPLVALVSVLGAVKLVGLWGIFIGPMVAAFFYALAQILRQRILAEREREQSAVEAQSGV